MLMLDVAHTVEQLWTCRDSGDGSPLPALLMELDRALIEFADWPGDLFDGIPDFLNDPATKGRPYIPR